LRWGRRSTRTGSNRPRDREHQGASSGTHQEC
jgi:hypothetical protein